MAVFERVGAGMGLGGDWMGSVGERAAPPTASQPHSLSLVRRQKWQRVFQIVDENEDRYFGSYGFVKIQTRHH